MPLLEIVRHGETSEDTIEISEVGESLGKTTILVNDVPGFATSRLGVVLGTRQSECWQRALHQRVILTLR